jgi:DNA-directed RNA polymerase subunit M/transcription elongation factor TFIIS
MRHCINCGSKVERVRRELHIYKCNGKEPSGKDVAIIRSSEEDIQPMDECSHCHEKRVLKETKSPPQYLCLKCKKYVSTVAV